MSSSHDEEDSEELPNDKKAKDEDLISIPEEWRTMNLQDLFATGYKPRIKTKPSGLSYITLRKGNLEKSLGPYDEDRWKLIMSMFPRKAPPPKVPSSPSHLLSIPVRRAPVFPKDFKPSLNVLRYFEILKDRAYPGDFNDFINEIIETHFCKCHGIVLPIVYEEQSENGREQVGN